MHATRDEPSILVVDDDDAAVAATARLLRTAGYRVASVSTGAECLSYVRNGAPKLVLLSAVLPDGDARDVCRQIKSDPSLAGIVVLFVFAHEAPPRDDVRGPESIADGYVVQPVPNDVLLAQIRTLLRLQAAEDGLRHAEETLARASALAKLGSATWDLERDESLFSDEWLRIHGEPPLVSRTSSSSSIPTTAPW
jgi:DNA-binding response OmpR family regulator